MAASRLTRPVALLAALTIAVGLIVRAAGGELGAALPPFVEIWAPRLHPLALLSAVVLLLGAWAAPRALGADWRPAAFGLWVFALALALGLGLSLARNGSRGWYEIFDLSPRGSFEAANEYLPALPALSHGPRFFLDRFSELIRALPVNGAGHPPGMLLLLDALGFRTAQGMAALCIGVGALGAPGTYVLTRALHGEGRARLAGTLFAFSPAVLLDGVTSADYLYAALGVGAACLLVRRGTAGRAVGAVVLAVGSFFSWALLALGLWVVLVAWRREGVRPALLLGLGCAVAVIALNAALAVVTGYDPAGALAATNDVYRHSMATMRPYAFWVFGSPVAWGVTLGVPLSLYALRALVKLDPAALALAVTILAAAVLGFTKAETERIWLMFVPLACVAAAAVLPAARTRTVLWALAAQAAVTQVLFDTIW